MVHAVPARMCQPVAHPFLAHGAARQEAVDDRTEPVPAVDRGGQAVRARRLDQRSGHPVVEGHRDGVRAQLVPRWVIVAATTCLLPCSAESVER